MIIYEYIINPNGTVHLATGLWIRHTSSARTVCGKLIQDTWDLGDETTSGIAASCGTCYRIARKGSKAPRI